MESLITAFIDYIKTEKGYSEHTLRNYESDLRQFSRFLAAKRATRKCDQGIDVADYALIRSYLGGLFNRCRRTTIARKLSALKSFFKYLELRGLTQQNPAAEIFTPKREHYIPTYLPIDDMFALLEQPDRDSALGMRDRAILELLYSSGLRVGELVGLSVENLDLESRLVRVEKRELYPSAERPLLLSESIWSIQTKSEKRRDTPRIRDLFFSTIRAADFLLATCIGW
jgi:integrase/recombinase XerC